MTEIGPTSGDVIRWAFSFGAWGAVGALIGAFHFLSLRWSVSKLMAGGALAPAIGIHLARFALVAAMLIGITRSFGAMPLLVAASGIWLARTAVVRMGARP